MRYRFGILGICAFFAFAHGSAYAQAVDAMKNLPRYDVDVHLDVARHHVQVTETVTWTNISNKPVDKIVFNAHAHYSVPDEDVGFMAKTLEILRMAPKEALSFDGPALQIEDVLLAPNASKRKANPLKLEHRFPDDNATALEIMLPTPLPPGTAVTLELRFHLKLPPRKGRWGQWDGITMLAQWLPVVAVHDDMKGWQPAHFIPWHQPFHNEAGHYKVKVTLPSDQKLAASSSVAKETDLGDGWKQIEHEPICVRDYALICSARFCEFLGESDGVKIRCLATPEHAFYGKALVEAAADAIPVYNQWFGRYPYPQFTIVEACFGWAGNECGGLVMIDDRIFGMPHVGKSYPTYLLQHELCHQWWYNVVGTNGYCETWMDEGLATYFSHRLVDQLVGKNNQLLEYPKGLKWLPNISRDDFRNYSRVGAWARGERHPIVQDMPKYEHLVNLSASAYDRGSKVVGLIEERMGEQAFLDFTRHIYRTYQFRILRVADFQRELEAFTGHSWEEFFRYWVHTGGMCDWTVGKVEINEKSSVFQLKSYLPTFGRGCNPACGRDEPLRVVVHLKQQGGFNEPTTLGIRIRKGEDYQIRIPIQPDVPIMELPELHAIVYCVNEQVGGKQRTFAKVEIALPCEPLQISVDPDRILLDERPTNNHWKSQVRWHLTPFYTQFDEVDVTNAYDRWNVNAGPGVFFASYNDPWYTKSMMAGLRLGVYRTQEIQAASYLGYRSNDRTIVAGADLWWDHVPLPNMQFGLSLEHSTTSLGTNIKVNRGVIYSRYVLMYGSSLYLPPFEYVETFGVLQNRGLPDPRVTPPGSQPFNERPAVGVHYHKNFMTPYWDAEGGYSLDATYQYGMPIAGNMRDFHQAYGQFAYVKSMGMLRGWFGEGAFRNWLADSRLAVRVGGAAALPNEGQFFALGGGDNFRGFDLAERQGSLIWLGSVEWRLPLCTNMHYDMLDHFVGLRNVYLAPFYDVGNAYVKGQPLGATAHAVGAGLRLDVIWLSMIERTTLRFDVAQTVNGRHPTQFWFGIQHPF
jgi:hypothetical protein